MTPVGTVFSHVLPSVQTAVRSTLLRAAVTVSPCVELEGFVIVDLRFGQSDESALDRVANAIRLVKVTDPKRARRIRRDIQRIVIMDLGEAGGSYISEIDACALDPHQVQERPIEATALIIVHEATHARIHKAGIKYTPRMRDRIEKLCVNEEIAFARRLSDGEQYIVNARRALEQPWWSVAAEHDREERQLRALRWPEWTIKVRRLFYRGPDEV